MAFYFVAFVCLQEIYKDLGFEFNLILINMLSRHLRSVFQALSSAKPPAPAAPVPVTPALNPEEYLVFPTKIPIFPYYYYASRINKYLYKYIVQNKIKHAVALTMMPGESKGTFIPFYEGHLVQKLGLKENSKEIGDTGFIDQAQRDNVNFISDEQMRSLEQVPVYYIDKISQAYPIGSLCKVYVNENDNNHYVYLRAEVRYEINTDKYQEKPGPVIYVSGRKIRNETGVEIAAEHKNLMEAYNRIYDICKINAPHVKESTMTKSLQLLGGYFCSLSYFTLIQKYNLFKTLSLLERTKALTEYFKEYAGILETEWKTMGEKYQRPSDEESKKEYFREIYEEVQNVLGHKADRAFIKKVKAKLATGRYPESIAKIIEVELQNLQDLSEGNPEINRKKQYINLLVDYPFGITAKQTFEIQKAKQILDEDHYGMKKLKQRILEFIAVSKLKGEFKSKVLLLHGPPGVGKTSIVKSIAKCLNRPYGRISLGGEYDTSLMKGHRKTYIGAYPGKIFDTISKAKAENPVILLDQIDKVQSRQGGASLQDVIMQVLDPIQNTKFKDEYMDIEIDLSKVLFVCTANQLDNIFPPLLDRLERIQVTGYTTGEKKQIFRRYIQKQAMQRAGIPDELMTRIEFTDEALHSLIEGYCKQAGIRNLVRKSNTIFNKTALKYVKNEEFDIQITPKTLQLYLGQPRFKQARLYDKIPPKGVIIGLAYNAYGGSILYIEAAASYMKTAKQQAETPASATTTTLTTAPTTAPTTEIKDLPQGSLIVTGNLHNVMKESCQLAYSYARYITSTFFNNNFLEVNDIHLNFPEIEIGKDGPSAGVAITCTLVSLALNKPAIREIAMTGEITLSGKVSAIGGVKQKTMGAKREGITTLIFPEENRRDVEELDAEVREGVTFHFAGHFFEVMDLVFGLKVQEQEASKKISAQLV